MVTRETRRAGCPGGCRRRSRPSAGGAASFAVTCHSRARGSRVPSRPRSTLECPCWACAACPPRASARTVRPAEPGTPRPRSTRSRSPPRPSRGRTRVVPAASAGLCRRRHRHRRRRSRTVDSASAGMIAGARLNSRPITRPGEVLEAVPGLIVTQHSGEGKANQFFLRGFNLDHGTDIAIYLDGMPVNMRTHGPRPGLCRHQFPDPRTRRRVRVPKGPYFAARATSPRPARCGSTTSTPSRTQPRADLARQLRLQARAHHRVGAARRGQPPGGRRGPGL